MGAGGADKSRAEDTDGGHVSSSSSSAERDMIQLEREGEERSSCLDDMSFSASGGGSVATSLTGICKLDFMTLHVLFVLRFLHTTRGKC